MALRFNSLADLPPDLAKRMTKDGGTVAQELTANKPQYKASKANLGKEFENELKTTHDYYRLKRLADVHRNENEWAYTTPQNAHKIASTAKGKNMVAKTEAGSYIIMVRSMVDFSGGGSTFSVRFDAKTVEKGDRIALSRFKDHQTTESYIAGLCGYKVSGFMVKFAEYKRVFYIPADKIRLLQEVGIRMDKEGPKSLTIDDLDNSNVAVSIPIRNGLIDWYEALIQD
jgi:penicillin-binding protein-related factor A (putative recombinase)